MKKVSSPTFDHEIYNISANEIFFSRSQSYPQNHTEIDVYGNFWSFIFANIPESGLLIRSQGQDFEASGPIGLVVPPHTIIQWMIRIPRLHWFAYCSGLPYPNKLPKELSVFDLKTIPAEVSPAWILDLVQNQKPIQVFKNSIANVYAKKFKELLDREFQMSKPLEAYAQELGISKEWLIRYFKKSYAVTPIVYRNKKRLLQAFVTLHSSQEKVIDLSQNVGFNDLKQFNALFKKAINLTPSQVKPTANLEC